MGALDAGVRRAGTGGSCDAKIARARSERFEMVSAIDGPGGDAIECCCYSCVYKDLAKPS